MITVGMNPFTAEQQKVIDATLSPPFCAKIVGILANHKKPCGITFCQKDETMLTSHIRKEEMASPETVTQALYELALSHHRMCQGTVSSVELWEDGRMIQRISPGSV